MADAPDPSQEKPARPPTDPVHAQRAMVYSLVAVMCLAGLVIAMALSDACKKYGGEEALAAIGKRCKNVVTFQDYLPTTDGWLALGMVLAVNILVYELRWVVRIVAPIALGVLYLVTAVLAFTKDLPMLLPVFYAVFGAGLLLSAWGIAKDRREGWAFALSMASVMLVAHFFGASKIATETGWPMAWAIVPSMAIMLPVVIALATTPPGARHYAPFASKPIA